MSFIFLNFISFYNYMRKNIYIKIIFVQIYFDSFLICIQRIYPYQLFVDENYKTDNIKPRVILNGNLYIKD